MAGSNNKSSIIPLGLEQYIAFDLETTGFDGRKCEIIEIAAARVVNGEITERFNKLIKPRAGIPLNIQKLTSITPDLVEDADREENILREFLDFIGDLPLLAHNVEFDVGFARSRLEKLDMPNMFNSAFDSLALARLLYPRLINHKLGTIAEFFGIDLTEAHRAFADVEALVDITNCLWDRFLSLPRGLVEQLAFLLRYSAKPGLSQIVGSARAQREKFETKPPLADPKFLVDLTNSIGKPDSSPFNFNDNDLIKSLSFNGPLPKFINGFAERDIQIKMAEKVIKSFKEASYLLAEAGTGTGKSFAYLIPSIFMARAENTRIVVSTKTKNLQEQLFFKDIPVLSRALPMDFKSVLLKGRQNYICRYRFDRFLSDPDQLSFSELDAFSSLVIWLWETDCGDIVENTSFSKGKYNFLWMKLLAEGRSCAGRKCPFYTECFVTKVRRSVDDANIVVVNHSLLFSDIESNTILGEYEHCIIDEAHSLEKVAADHFGDGIAPWRFRGALSELYTEYPKEGGAIIDIVNQWTEHEGPGSHIDDRSKGIIDSVKDIEQEIDQFFNRFSGELEKIYHWKSARYTVRERYEGENKVFKVIKPIAEKLMSSILELVDQIEIFLGEIPDDDEKLSRSVGEAHAAGERLAEIAAVMTILLNPKEAGERVLWMESPSGKDKNDASLAFAPLDIDELVYKFLLQPRKSVIMTSATLSIAGNFDYIQKRLGFYLAEPERVETFLMSSPYDFDNQLVFVTPMWMPPTKSSYFNDKLSELLMELSLKLRRGTLALFTSYAMLKDVYGQVAEELESEGIPVLAQSLTGSRSSLTRAFREEPESVLLGTESFWEGVDVPGESLEILILAKLPFAVPSEPYIAAQLDRIAKRGGNAFMEYSVPEAVIKFRQGIGRLIRSETDIGALIVLDTRIVKSAYGREFVNSAPVRVNRVSSTDQLIAFLTDHLA